MVSVEGGGTSWFKWLSLRWWFLYEGLWSSGEDRDPLKGGPRGFQLGFRRSLEEFSFCRWSEGVWWKDCQFSAGSGLFMEVPDLWEELVTLVNYS